MCLYVCACFQKHMCEGPKTALGISFPPFSLCEIGSLVRYSVHQDSWPVGFWASLVSASHLTIGTLGL